MILFKDIHVDVIQKYIHCSLYTSLLEFCLIIWAWVDVGVRTWGLKERRCCIALCDRPENLEIYDDVGFKKKKNVLKHLKLRNIIQKRRWTKKKNISDRPTHVLAPNGQYNIFFFPLCNATVLPSIWIICTNTVNNF